MAVLSILRWENPYKTGVIFGFLNLIFFLMVVEGFSFVSVVCSVLIYLGTFLFLANLTSPEKLPEDNYEFIDRETVEKLIVTLHDTVQYFVSIKHDYESLIQTFLVLYLISYFSCCCSTMWNAILIAFVAPLVYERRSKEISPILENAKAKIMEAKLQVSGMIPKGASVYKNK